MLRFGRVESGGSLVQVVYRILGSSRLVVGSRACAPVNIPRDNSPTALRLSFVQLDKGRESKAWEVRRQLRLDADMSS